MIHEEQVQEWWKNALYLLRLRLTSQHHRHQILIPKIIDLPSASAFSPSACFPPDAVESILRYLPGHKSVCVNGLG